MLSILNGIKKSKLAKLYEEYRIYMYYAAYHILNDEASSEDAVQNAFLKILRNIDKVNGKDCHKTKSFMVIISRNEAINIYNKRKLDTYVDIEEVQDYLPDANLMPLEQLISTEGINKIIEDISSLNPIYSDVLLLKYSHGYNNAEISKIMEISEETIRKRLERGKKKLQIIREEVSSDEQK